MGIYSIKPAFQRTLRGAELFLVARRVHPDYLTLMAVALSCLGGVALYAANYVPWLLLVVPVLAIGRISLNALDGLVARGTGLARAWGEVLNEVCDRLSDMAFFAGLALAPGSDFGLGAAVLVAMLLSSYAGTAAKAAGGQRQYGGIMGKADRMVWLSLASLLAFALPGLPIFLYFLIVVLVGLIVTIAQRLKATYDDLNSPKPAR